MPEDDLDRNRLMGRTDNGEAKAKKKKIIIGSIVGLVVVAVIIILICTLGGGDKPDDGPPVPQGYNPYNVDESTIEMTNNEAKGVIVAGDDVKTPKPSIKLAGAEQLGATVDAIDPSSIPQGKNNEIIKRIRYHFQQINFQTSRLVLTDDENERFSPPEEFVYAQTKDYAMRNSMMGLQVTNAPFNFKYQDYRTDAHDFYFSTEDQALLMMDKFIQMDIKLPSQRLFGLGERNRQFQLEEGAWTMWSKSNEEVLDDGSGGKQGAGVHPFVLAQAKNTGEFVGMYFRNTNAQSPIIKYNDDGTSTFSYITTGGNIDILFFAKGTAMDIIKQYQNAVGKPSMPPFWALGWHASSYDYKTLDDVKANVEGYKKAGMPLEGIWLDIPYMDNFQDFTVDSKNFKDLAAWADSIHQTNQKLIVIVDPGLGSSDPSGKYWRKAKDNDALIKSSINLEDDYYRGVLVADVYQNRSVFLDLLNDIGVSVWEEGLKDLWDQTHFDGLWLDMNEFSTFCDGECPPKKVELPEASSKRKLRLAAVNDDSWFIENGDQSEESTYYMPFIPAMYNLDQNTLSLNATHPQSGYTQYDLHNLNGHIQAKKTNDWLQQRSDLQGKRSFVLSKSTFSGSGQWASHWMGDNFREWAFLNQSISGIMNFNMFGIPMTGPDVCGFSEARNTKEKKQWEEICGRWLQLSTFYPFARQHRDQTQNGTGGNSTEPYKMSEPYQSWAKSALQSRLQYSRQLYSCLFEASQNGGTCFDPLMFHYPKDEGALEKMEHNFIFADALKVTPIMNSKVKKIASYFPAGEWVNMNNFSDVVTSPCPKESKYEWDCVGTYGDYVILPVDQEKTSMIPTFLKPGAMVAFQDNSDGKYMTTQDLIGKPVTLIANRDHMGHAEGKLYLDDGISLAQKDEYYNFVLSANSVKKQVIFANENPSTSPIYKIVITNAKDLNETDFACVTSMDALDYTAISFAYDDKLMTLTLSTEGGFSAIKMRDIYFGSSKKDLNLCAQATQDSYYYHTQDFKMPDLSKNEVKFYLNHTSPAVMDVAVKLILMNTTTMQPIVNMEYYYVSKKGFPKAPFHTPMPTVNKKLLFKDGKLSDWVTITQEKDKPFKIAFKGLGQSEVVSFDNLLTAPYYSMQEHLVKTNPQFPGVIGLTERTSTELKLKDGVYGLWSLDTPNPVEDGKLPGKNLYGVHPFFMGMDEDKNWFGVFSNSAAAQDWWVVNGKDDNLGQVSLTQMSTGGVGDLYFFSQHNPEAVTKMYHTYIVGQPVYIPQWALGWHQSRWGYSDTDHLRQVVQNYSDNQIPLDVQWSDIDYMTSFSDFTFDQFYFKDLPDFVDELHDKNMRYVPILDAGIAISKGTGYEAYEDGLEKGIFIKDKNGNPVEGKVWPGDASFPDFMTQDGQDYWKSQLENLESKIHFDGLWMDMNEASNFVNGAKYSFQQSTYPVKWNLPYVPTGRDLEMKSLPLDAVHGDGTLELDAHSLFGKMEVSTTHDWFTDKKMRTMIIERSAYAGTGSVASRWLGDNFADVSYMAYSITGVMAHNIIGIPFAGSDICGFIDSTTPELCSQWHTVGAFYPFTRNHNSWNTDAQEPWVFKSDIYSQTVTHFDIIQQAIRFRYSLIRFYYTELMRVSREGGTFFRPLFFAFPEDPMAYLDQNLNVMLGDAVKLSVNSDNLTRTETDFYFPAATWCSLFSTNLKTETCFTSTGEMKTLSTKPYEHYAHLRDGHIVPLQDGPTLSKAGKMNNTVDLQKIPVDLHINPTIQDTTLSAAGQYFNDDGVTLMPNNQGNLYIVSMTGQSATSMTITFGDPDVKHKRVNNNDGLGTIYFYNAAAMGFDATSQVTLTKKDGNKEMTDAKYEESIDALRYTSSAADEGDKSISLGDIESIFITKLE